MNEPALQTAIIGLFSGTTLGPQIAVVNFLLFGFSLSSFMLQIGLWASVRVECLTGRHRQTCSKGSIARQTVAAEELPGTWRTWPITVISGAIRQAVIASVEDITTIVVFVLHATN